MRIPGILFAPLLFRVSLFRVPRPCGLCKGGSFFYLSFFCLSFPEFSLLIVGGCEHFNRAATIVFLEAAWTRLHFVLHPALHPALHLVW